MSSQLAFEIGEAMEVKGTKSFSLPFYEYNITVRVQGRADNARMFARRYNDFLALRNMFSAKYWACVVPPIPEKEGAAETIDKLKNAAAQVVKGKDDDSVQSRKTEELLQYRRDLLRIFLQKLGEHPVFGNDELLTRYFIDDDEWERQLKENIQMPAFLSVGILGSWKGAAKRSAGDAAGITFAKVVQRLKDAPDTGLSGSATALSPTEIEGIARHVNNLATNFASLKTRAEALAHKRRESADALQQFATCFAAIVEDEDDEALKKVVNPVALHCGSMSTLYEKQYKAELKNVVFKLGYHHLNSLAVGETLERLYVAVQYIEQLKNNYNAIDAKITNTTAPEKSTALQNQRNEVGIRKREVENAVNDGMEKFKSDFVRYHDLKQQDMLQFLEVFKKVQMNSAEQMKKEWDDVQATAEIMMA